MFSGSQHPKKREETILLCRRSTGDSQPFSKSQVKMFIMIRFNQTWAVKVKQSCISSKKSCSAPGSGSDIRKRRIKVGWVRTTCSSCSVCFGKRVFRGLLQWSQSFSDEAQTGRDGGVGLKSEVIKENLPGTIHNLPTKQPVILTAIYEENTFQGFLGSLTATSASTKQHSASVLGGWVFHEATERCLSTVQGRYCT